MPVVAHAQAQTVYDNTVPLLGARFTTTPAITSSYDPDAGVSGPEIIHPTCTVSTVRLESPGSSGTGARQYCCGDHLSSILLDRGEHHKHTISFHIRGSENGRVTCQWQGCNVQLKRESITKHVLNTHLGRKYGCTICGKWYKGEKSSVRRHAKTAHPKESLEIVEGWGALQ